MSDRRRRRARPDRPRTRADRARERAEDRPDGDHGDGDDAREPREEFEADLMAGRDRAADAASADAAAVDHDDERDADARARAEALAEFERTRDAMLRAGRGDRTGRRRTREDREPADRIPVRGGAPKPRPNPSPRPAPAVATATVAPTGGPSGPRVGRSYSLFTPRARAVRRDGPMAWAGRRYRRFRRGLRENITAYGHRYNAVGGDATEGRPLLLWLVDAPRLFAMYFDHAEYRLTRGVTLLFRELRARPPRIEWDKHSVHSPLVGFSVPTCEDVNPFWRWPAVVAFWAAFREDWRAALAETFGGLAAIWANAKAELAAEIDALFSRFSGVLGWLQANLTRFDRLFRGSDDGAWVFACGTGLAGLTLTAFLFLYADEAAAGPDADPAAVVSAGIKHHGPDIGGWNDDDFDGEHGDPDDFGEDVVLEPEPRDRVFRPDPGPVARAASDLSPDPWDDADPGGSDFRPVARATSPGPLPDPFGDGAAADDWAVPAYGPELGVTFERRELPPEIDGFVPPDDDRQATVTAADSGRRPLPDDPGGWAYADGRSARGERFTPPPALRGDGRADAVSLAPLAPTGEDDGVTPVASGLGLSVTRTPAADGGDGRMTYELRVRNDGDEPAAAAVEETVGAGVTVVAAEPPAAFTESTGGRRDAAVGPLGPAGRRRPDAARRGRAGRRGRRTRHRRPRGRGRAGRRRDPRGGAGGPEPPRRGPAAGVLPGGGAGRRRVRPRPPPGRPVLRRLRRGRLRRSVLRRLRRRPRPSKRNRPPPRSRRSRNRPSATVPPSAGRPVSGTSRSLTKIPPIRTSRTTFPPRPPRCRTRPSGPPRCSRRGRRSPGTAIPSPPSPFPKRPPATPRPARGCG